MGRERAFHALNAVSPDPAGGDGGPLADVARAGGRARAGAAAAFGSAAESVADMGRERAFHALNYFHPDPAGGDASDTDSSSDGSSYGYLGAFDPRSRPHGRRRR